MHHPTDVLVRRAKRGGLCEGGKVCSRRSDRLQDEVKGRARSPRFGKSGTL